VWRYVRTLQHAAAAATAAAATAVPYAGVAAKAGSLCAIACVHFNMPLLLLLLLLLLLCHTQV
jgi:hypothetical protein